MSFMVSIGLSIIQSKLVKNTLSNANETITNDESKPLPTQAKESELVSNEINPKTYLACPIFKLSIKLYNYLFKKSSSSHEDTLDFYLSRILDATSWEKNENW